MSVSFPHSRGRPMPKTLILSLTPPEPLLYLGLRGFIISLIENDSYLKRVSLDSPEMDRLECISGKGSRSQGFRDPPFLN